MTDHLPLPGQVPVSGVGFLYVEASNQRAFDKFFPEIGRWIKKFGNAIPKGGVVTENITITVPSGKRFFGISFHGDVEVWESGVAGAAAACRCLIGKVEGQTFVVDERAIPLADCEIQSYGY